ncbi:MAG TPA: hypothetical protein VJC11_00420 [Patescibacteria group bacterium]|nr:hypothetical protein [Patescibacteria group bacterium]
MMYKPFREKMIIAAGVAMLLVGAFATVVYATNSWGNYHWARTANPFTLKLGDNVSSAWDSHLQTASSDWSVSDVLDTTVVAGQSNRSCKATKGRVEVCNRTYGNNGWLGLAQIWVSGGHITQGVAKMNDTYFNTAPYNNSDERQHVICQEIGHTLGLDHQSIDGGSLGTCMDYSNSPSSTHPNQHDYDELAAIYNAHLDTTITVGQTVTNGKVDINLDGRADWGKEVKKTSNGHASLFERDLGNGHKVFTFVTWAN